MGLRDTILAASDLKAADVEVPEWGVTVQVREMSAAGRMAFQDAMAGKQGSDAYLENLARMVILCARDPETGEQVFTDADVDQLKTKSLGALRCLGEKALEINRMKESAETAKGN